MKVLALVAIGACIPATTTTTRRVNRELSAPVAGEPGKLQTRADFVDGALVVTAQWARYCRRDVFDTIETKHTTHMDLVGTDEGATWGYLLVPVLLIAYPAGIADFLLAGIAVIAKGTHVESSASTIGSFTLPCPIPARATTLHVRLPSGREIDGMTDARGELVVVLPRGEDRGDVVVRAEPSIVLDARDPLADEADGPERSEPPPVPVSPPVPVPPPPVPVPPPRPARRRDEALVTVYRAAVDCAGQLGVSAVVTIHATIDPAGRFTEISTDQRGKAFADCLGDGLADARFAGDAGRTFAVPFKLHGRIQR